MLRESTAAKVSSKISDSNTLPVSAHNPNGIESLEAPGTSHIVTADASGMAVSLSSIINLWFGSKLIVPETGLVTNNEMDDFSIPGDSNAFGYIPSPANYIVPGKRPLSSMSPLIVDFLPNGTFYYTLGGVGGSYIITATIQCLWYVLDRGMDLARALAAPGFHDQLVPDNIEFEYAYDSATTAFMAARGHNVIWAERESYISALRRLADGAFEAAADPDYVDGGGISV
jgi:gamma-glutamyltranspeptidase/glutathione hydrolase